MVAVAHIARLPSGHVDRSCSHAKAVRRALQHIAQLDDQQKAQAICELLPKLHRLGWWELFNKLAFPGMAKADPAPFHRDFWRWATNLSDHRPRPFAAIWPRGAAKTSNIELWLAWWLVDNQDPREYAIYVAETQKQANKKLADIATLMRSPLMRHAFPEAAAVYIDSRGQERGVSKDRLRFGNGRTIDAVGMDTAVRGIKLDEYRPGIIVFDDLEKGNESAHVTQQKIDAVGTDILAADDPITAVLYIQNLIKPDGIMSQVASDNPPFMTNRIKSGPYPQIEGLEFVRVERLDEDGEPETAYKITKGTPTWPEGLGLEASEGQLTSLGPRYFLREKQNDVTSTEGALWDHKKIQDMTRPDFWPGRQGRGVISHVVGVDPSTGDGTAGECGIVVAALAADGNCYIVEDASLAAPPSVWVKRVEDMWRKYKANAVVVERNHGQELLRETIAAHSVNLPVELVNAKKGKKLRAEPIETLSSTGKLWLAGDFPLLDFQMRTYTGKPNEDSPDRLDAFVYAAAWLMLDDDELGELLSVSGGTTARR